jgi:small subunit ribosomal protein S21
MKNFMKIKKSNTQKTTPSLIITGLSVEVRDGNINKALRIFNKKVQDDGRLRDIKDRQYYEKPTTKRKREAQVARKRWLKKLESSNPSKQKKF